MLNNIIEILILIHRMGIKWHGFVRFVNVVMSIVQKDAYIVIIQKLLKNKYKEENILETNIISISILMFIITIHIGLLFIKNQYKNKLEMKVEISGDAIRIFPDKEKGEDFEEFGIYEPILDYLKNSSIVDYTIIVIGVSLTLITIFYDSIISLIDC